MVLRVLAVLKVLVLEELGVRRVLVLEVLKVLVLMVLKVRSRRAPGRGAGSERR